ncbi:DUF2218 domain-containing protein [Methylobacillus caricis]|uniref:DUF2218 domain-containing protein n=1 Tax=Methylobacillus caricis TaxID=1971611 RepID=UPI001CFFBABD|nr:DUF2218 domain-containing protein [Methylobacillus caricis]MCB5187023.1 DUF2218 domain-containing protein [Methylobacillus caricis]
MECKAAAPEQLDRIQYMLDEHIALFSRRSPMAVLERQPLVRQDWVLAWPAASTRDRAQRG